VGTFSPDWWSLPGLKDQPIVSVGAKTQIKGQCDLWSRLVVPTGIEKATFSPGLNHRPGIKVPTAKVFCTIRWAGDSSPGWWFQLGLNLLLLPGQIPARTKDKNQKSVLY
jgi:hypothetical protein